MEQNKFLDRSRVLAFRQCPRQRFLAYHFNGVGGLGNGIRAAQFSIPLATGGNIHEGLADLLAGVPTDSAVAHAIGLYNEMANESCGIHNANIDQFSYTIDEQSALTEALIRAYSIVQLPKLLDEYEVLEVEQEYEFDVEGATWMSRLDGLLRKRSDRQIFVQSFKTDKGNKLEDKIKDARIDLQGLTEPLAVEQRMALWRQGVGDMPQWAAEWVAEHPNERFLCGGVKMEWLVKGNREKLDNGHYLQDSFLVRPWTRGEGAAREFAWTYFYPCPRETHTIVGANGRPWKCYGDSKSHGLGSSWTRCNIWEFMTIREWIELLAVNAVYPKCLDGTTPLDKVIFAPAPIFRNEADQIRRWRGIRVQEGTIRGDLRWIEGDDDMLTCLDAAFPKFDHTCNHSFGGPCEFQPICWNSDEAAALKDAISLGFEPRVPNHAAELIQLQGASK